MKLSESSKHLMRSRKMQLVLAYFLISFIVVTVWFSSSDLLVYTDTHFPFMNLKKYVERVFTILNTGYFPSSYDIRHLILYTYALPFMLFTAWWDLQLASIAQRLFLFLALFFSFCSISYFLSCISEITKQKLSRIAIFITALFYVFNTYAAIAIWRPFMPYILHYALFPFFLGLSLQFFSKNEPKYLLSTMLVSFFLFPSYTLTPSLFFDLIFVAILFLSVKRTFNRNIKQLFFSLAKVFATVFLLSIPLIAVVLSENSLIFTQYSDITSITESPQSLVGLIKYNSPNMLRALFYSGYPPLYTSHFSWYQYYTSQFEPLMLITVGFLITIGVIVGTNRKKGNILWFGLLFIWLAFLFLITGSNNPLPELKLQTFQIKPFDVLRSVYARFGEHAILASLPFVCLGLQKIISLRRSRLYMGIVSLLCYLLLVVPIFPVLNGDFLRTQSPYVPSDQVQFPTAYLALDNIDEQNDFLYITIPASASVTGRLWNNGTSGYIGPDIFPFILSGASLSDGKIRDNVLYNILHGNFETFGKILPVKYLILTFDQLTTFDVQRLTVKNYHLILQKILKTVYSDENLAVFELPSQVQNGGESWRLLPLNQEVASIANDIFCSSYYTLVYQNLSLDVNYVLPNYFGKALTFAGPNNGSVILNKMEIKSTLNLKTTTEGYYIYPIFIVLPNVTERLYLAAEFKPTEGVWNIYSGFWSAETLHWNFTLLTNSISGNLSFITDFTKNRIVIENDTTTMEFPIPEKWISLIDQRLENPTLQNLGGEIGVYAGKNLTDIASVDDLVVKIYGNNSVHFSNSSVPLLDSKRISPTSFRAIINSTEPFGLAFLETYDQLWNAYVNGKKINSSPLYGIFNVFWVNQTGQLDISIEYESQRWFYIGCAISLTTFFACITYLTYNWTKNKAIWKRTKRTIARVRLILHLNPRENPSPLSSYALHT